MDMSGLRFVLHDEYDTSIKQLAERIGVNDSYLSSVASGKEKSETVQQKVLEALNLTEEEYISKQGICRVRRQEKELKARTKKELAFTAKDDRLNPGIVEDYPDYRLKKATDAELRQRKHIACGNRCDLCKVKCALGREILKRGILYGEKAKAEAHAEPEKDETEVIGYLTADENGEVVAMTVEEHDAMMAEEEAPAEQDETHTAEAFSEAVSAETYPVWLVELLLENAEPSNKEFIGAYFGGNIDRMTAAQVADIKRSMVSFEKLKAEVRKEMATDV